MVFQTENQSAQKHTHTHTQTITRGKQKKNKRTKKWTKIQMNYDSRSLYWWCSQENWIDELSIRQKIEIKPEKWWKWIMPVWMFACMVVLTYIYIYIHTHTHRRNTERELTDWLMYDGVEFIYIAGPWITGARNQQRQEQTTKAWIKCWASALCVCAIPYRGKSI